MSSAKPSLRQKKVARLVQKELSTIIPGYHSHLHGAMVTVTEVRVTPDLSVARVNLSVFNTPSASVADDIVSALTAETSDIRGKLGSAVRHQLRIIPKLEFFLDTTLDRVFRIEELLKKAKGQ